MYRIGEFSILNQVTIKTLRYYDEINLFKPKVVDDFTGYRYYDDSQQEEFDKISKYKYLRFSLDQIKILIKEKDKEIIQNKIKELVNETEDNNEKIKELKNMIGGNIMNIEYKVYDEKFKIGKRVSLKNRDDIEKVLKEVEIELDALNIDKGNPVVCNFELGFVNEDIDAFVGYEVNEFQIPKELLEKVEFKSNELELMRKSKCDKFLVGTCSKFDIDDTYSEIVKYAHDNKIQIRGFFTEIYTKNNVLIIVEAYDLEKTNDDYLEHLKKVKINEKLNINIDLIGKWTIREILPSMKYMFNENKQKSMLDTKYSSLELKKDGSTNYENITWNDNNLYIKYNDLIISYPLYINKINGSDYLSILMNENIEYYKSQRPLFYIYKR